MIHQGNILKKLLKSSEMPIGEFAELSGYSRQYLYLIYGKEKLEDSLINKTCEILNINKQVFFNENTFVQKKSNLENRLELLEKKYVNFEILVKQLLAKSHLSNGRTIKRKIKK